MLIGCLRQGLHRAIGLAALSLVLLASFEAAAVTRSVSAGHSISQWTVEDGLAHNLPLAITQDRAGWLWVATWEGVMRFNGRSFTTFDRSNADGADLAGASSLLAEKDGSVLAGTDHGVYRFHRGRWQLLPGLAGHRVEQMYRSRNGVLWATSGERLVGLHADGRLQEVALGSAPRQVFGLAELADGRLLLGSENGLFVLAGDGVQRWAGGHQLGDSAVFHISADGKGWLLATESGAWQLTDSGRLRPLGPRLRVDRVVRGQDARLWLNPHQGPLLCLDAGGRQLPFDLPGLRARTLFVDADAGIWAGSTHGLFRLSHGAGQQLPGSDGYVRAVLEAADRSLWLAHGSGLRRWQDGQARELLDALPGMAGASVMSLAPTRDGTGVWVGTYDRGVLRFANDGSLRQRIAADMGLSSGQVRALAQGHDGTLWIGNAALGLLRWHDGRLTPLPSPFDLPLGQIQVLQADAAGGVWLGTTRGLAHIDAQGTWRRWALETGLPARSVFDIVSDADGTLWLATDRGLLRYRDKRFAVFDHTNGLPQERLFRILDDGHHLWLSSNRGVLQVARTQVEAVLDGDPLQPSVWVVDHADGLPGQTNGGSWPAGWRSADGRLLFPTGDGVGEILPARLQAERSSQLSVAVAVETVMVDGQLRSPFGSVVMPPDARRLRVEYIGLDFQAPARVRYRYRLAGFDPDWIEAGRIPVVSYTNLPAGSYQFEVEAVSLPRDWDDRTRVGSTTLRVVVQAPLWRHPMVIAAAVLGLAGLVYAIVWWRTRRYVRRQQRLKRVIAASTRALTMKNDLLEANSRERDALMRQLAHQASHDALTGLPNRRAAELHLQRALAQAQTYGTPLGVALLDVDHFKAINDGYGHDAGDQVLRALGQRLSDLRGTTMYGSRHGGEEFLLILEGLDDSEAWQTLERLRQAIAHAALALEDGRELRYTVSIGMASFGPETSTMRQLLATADSHLYAAKGQGRNRVVG